MTVTKKKKTTELIFTIVGSALTAGMGTGIIPPDLFEFGKAALETAQAGSASGASDVQIIVDVIYKCISLGAGAWIISAYAKSRGVVKSAEAVVAKAQVAINE